MIIAYDLTLLIPLVLTRETVMVDLGDVPEKAEKYTSMKAESAKFYLGHAVLRCTSIDLPHTAYKLRKYTQTTTQKPYCQQS
jgi:hypothetical protein